MVVVVLGRNGEKMKMKERKRRMEVLVDGWVHLWRWRKKKVAA